MNVPAFLKREMTQWLVFPKQPPLQIPSETEADDPLTPMLVKGGAPVACYTARLLNGKLTVTVPQMLQPVAPEKQTLKTQPDVILTDRNGTVKLTVTQLYQKAMRDSEVIEYQNQVKKALKKLNPAMEWLLGGVKEVRGLPIAFFEVITPQLGVGVYQLSFFLPLQQRVVSGKLICADQTLKEWRPVFHQMLESIQVRQAVKKNFRNLLHTFC